MLLHGTARHGTARHGTARHDNHQLYLTAADTIQAIRKACGLKNLFLTKRCWSFLTGLTLCFFPLEKWFPLRSNETGFNRIASQRWHCLMEGGCPQPPRWARTPALQPPPRRARTPALQLQDFRTSFTLAHSALLLPVRGEPFCNTTGHNRR